MYLSRKSIGAANQANGVSNSNCPRAAHTIFKRLLTGAAVGTFLIFSPSAFHSNSNYSFAQERISLFDILNEYKLPELYSTLAGISNI